MNAQGVAGIMSQSESFYPSRRFAPSPLIAIRITDATQDAGGGIFELPGNFRGHPPVVVSPQEEPGDHRLE